MKWNLRCQGYIKNRNQLSPSRYLCHSGKTAVDTCHSRSTLPSQTIKTHLSILVKSAVHKNKLKRLRNTLKAQESFKETINQPRTAECVGRNETSEPSKFTLTHNGLEKTALPIKKLQTSHRNRTTSQESISQTPTAIFTYFGIL